MSKLRQQLIDAARASAAAGLNKVTSGNNLVKAITYAYGPAQTPQTGQTACSPQGNLAPGTTNGTSYTGPHRKCEWDASPYAPETEDVTSGTCVVNNPTNKSSTP